MSTSPFVLFVCLHGAAKSVIASQYFRRLAGEPGIPANTDSAGTEPDPEIPPGVVRGLRGDGIGMRAAMRGIVPAVIGVLAVSPLRLGPHALVDPFAVIVLVGTVIAILYWRVGTMKLMALGALIGVVRSRWSLLQAVRSALTASLGHRM